MKAKQKVRAKNFTGLAKASFLALKNYFFTSRKAQKIPRFVFAGQKNLEGIDYVI